MRDQGGYRGPAGPVVGVLGGMGPLATADFLAKLIRRTPVQQENEHIPTVVWCNPQVPDRTKSLLGSGPSPLPALIDGVRRLTDAGATLIAIPCNTAHAFLGELVANSDVAFVDMMAATAAAIRTTYPHVRRVGVLSTAGTRQARLYEAACERVTLTTAVLAEPDQAALVDPAIAEIKRSGDSTRARVMLRRAAEVLVRDQAEVVIAGCTEIPLVLETMSGTALVDATDCLAAAVVDRVCVPR